MFLEDLWPPLDRLANPAANPTEVQVIVPPPPPWASSSFSSSFSHGGALSLWVALALLLAYVRRRTEKGPFFPSSSSFQTLREREREREREPSLADGAMCAGSSKLYAPLTSPPPPRRRSRAADQLLFTHIHTQIYHLHRDSVWCCFVSLSAASEQAVCTNCRYREQSSFPGHC